MRTNPDPQKPTAETRLKSARLVWCLLIGLILVTGALVAYSRWQSYLRDDTNERDKLAFQVRLVEENVSGLIRGINAALHQISRETVEYKGDCNRLRLERYAALYPEVRSFSVVDKHGIVYCSSLPKVIGAGRSASEMFTAAQARPGADALYVEKPRKGVGDDPIITFSRSVADGAGQVSYLVLASVDLHHFDAMLKLLGAEGQPAALLHESGIIASTSSTPDKSRFKDISKGPSHLANHLASGQRLHVQRSILQVDGSDRFGASSDVIPVDLHPSSRLIISVTEKADRVFMSWRNDTILYLSIWGGASIVMVVLFLLLLHRENSLVLARDEALAASRAKSKFLSSMSHELRTPLNAILGFAQLISNMESDPKILEYSGQIEKAGWHLLDLVNDVLDIAKIESRQMSLSIEPVIMRDLGKEWADLARPLAARRNMQLVVDFADDGCVAKTDRLRLKQCLLNYLSNAAKYGREGGEIRFLMRCSDGKVRCEVADDGDGIPAHQLKALFEPFNRLGLESGNIQGAGLGLALTRQLAELMGGQAGANSEPGKGSVFWIELEELEHKPARL
jgi:signal transduction histidine kinase